MYLYSLLPEVACGILYIYKYQKRFHVLLFINAHYFHAAYLVWQILCKSTHTRLQDQSD